MKSLSTYLMTRGVLALIVEIIAVAWPGVTVYALIWILGIANNGFGYITHLVPPGVPEFDAYYRASEVWPAESLTRRRALR